MVKKFTLLELHLDDARFSNAVANTTEEAEEMLDEMDADEMNVDAMDDGTSGRSLGRALRMAALATVVAVGVRTIARRFRTDDAEMDEAEMDEMDAAHDDESVEVDLDDAVEA